MSLEYYKKNLPLQELRIRKLPKNFVPGTLILAGSLLVGYVLTQYGEMYLEQKRMAEQWEKEQQRVGGGTSSERAHAQRGDGLARLVIPKIELSSFIVEGTNRRSLLLGPGHLTNTAEPGETGNAVLSGHRDTFFRHIHELEEGDLVYVERGGKRYAYQVTGKKVVEPNDLSVTHPSADSELTLITCYPTYYIGPAPKRLVVFSKLQNRVERLSASEDLDEKPGSHIETIGSTH
jgi:sortase A